MSTTTESTNNTTTQDQQQQTQQPPIIDPRIILGNGLYLLLSPVIKECDSKIQEVYQSQKNLSEQIDSLSNELEKFNSLTQVPTLHPHIQKLLNARGRLLAVNSKLGIIMTRLDKLSTSVLQNQQQKTSVSDRISLFFKSKPSPVKPQQTSNTVLSASSSSIGSTSSNTSEGNLTNALKEEENKNVTLEQQQQTEVSSDSQKEEDKKEEEDKIEEEKEEEKETTTTTTTTESSS